MRRAVLPDGVEIGWARDLSRPTAQPILAEPLPTIFLNLVASVTLLAHARSHVRAGWLHDGAREALATKVAGIQFEWPYGRATYWPS